MDEKPYLCSVRITDKNGCWSERMFSVESPTIKAVQEGLALVKIEFTLPPPSDSADDGT
jgi:hypothetical protein